MKIEPGIAEKILDADFANILKKVKDGKTLTAAERAIVAAKKMGTTEDVKAYATTKATLARMIGVSRQNLNKLCKDETFPKPDPAGRWNVAACIEWLKSTGRTAGGDSSVEDERLRNWRAKNEKLEMELAILKGEYVAVTRVIEAHSKFSQDAKKCLKQKLENEYPSAVAKLDVAQARVFGKRLFDQVMDEFTKFAEVWAI